RADLSRPARSAPPPLEGAARLLAPRLHDRPGASGARPSRTGLRDVHPPAAPQRRHRRLVPAGYAVRPGTPRLQADAARPTAPPRPGRRDRRRRGRCRPERQGARRTGALRARADDARARPRDRGGYLATPAPRATPPRAA